jgi:hypothetical protein
MKQAGWGAGVLEGSSISEHGRRKADLRSLSNTLYEQRTERWNSTKEVEAICDMWEEGSLRSVVYAKHSRLNAGVQEATYILGLWQTLRVATGRSGGSRICETWQGLGWYRECRI